MYVHGMDQTLPEWTAALDPVDLLWNDSASVCDPSQQEAASVVCFPSASHPSARPVPNSTQPGSQAQSGAAAAARHHQMWEPVPFAPDDFRDEAFNLLTAPALTTVRPQPEVQPTEQEHSQSAPTSSGFVDGTEDSKQRDMSALSRTRSQTNSSEQKQANARESQKRFRLRQKARSQAIEAQLASTVAELCNLRVRQQYLESRNQLLEKCSSLTSSRNSEQDGPYEKLYIAHETDASENGPSVTISVQGGRHQMTVQEISLMPVAEFASLWTEYIRLIGACLIQLEQKQDPRAQSLMEKLTVESSRLIGCIKLLNHDVHKAMLDGKLDPGLANTHKLGAAFYTNLTRLLAFSEEQTQDLMLLRRLYVTRRGLHAMERRALISQTPVSQNQIPLPCDNLTQLSDLASQLKKNAENDYRVYHRVACAARRGVYTTKQWAIMIVQSYPYLPTLEFHFEIIAAERGEPSRAELVANAQTNTMAAEWRHLNKYLEVIASSKTHDYIPLSEKPVKSLYPADASMSFGAEAALNLHYMMA